jgi:hypothetical protein
MEQHSRSNVAMLAARGTFIAGTAAVTVTEARYSTKLVQQALCTICLTDMTRRAHCTVKLGKDNSPSSMMDHLRIHHLVEFDAVAVANSKGLTLAAFKTQQKEPRVCALLGNSSAGQSAEQSLATPNATANAGNAAGAARH